MWHLLSVLLLLASTGGIKVPVDDKEDTTELVSLNDTARISDGDVYYQPEDSSLDSYLLPPDIRSTNAEYTDVQETLPTYLVPPLPAKQIDFYHTPTVQPTQSDWYPIAEAQPSQQHYNPLSSVLQTPRDQLPILFTNSNQPEITGNNRKGKKLQSDRIIIPIPSRELEPPQLTAEDYSQLIPLEEFQLPSVDVPQPFRISTDNDYNVNGQKLNVDPTVDKNINFQKQQVEPLTLHLVPPKLTFTKYNNPTKLYPKKYLGGFKPIPIPLAPFVGDLEALPKAKPAAAFNPILNVENDYLIPIDEKAVYNYQQLEEKRKLKGEINTAEPQEVFPVEKEAPSNPGSAEQDVSESNQRYPAQDAPRAQELQVQGPVVPAEGERTEFRMHGMKGPHSYQFGYDTGKGKNRQFRYEERDNDGHVRGHYGYMDKHGKMRVVNYDADPEHGFHAEPPTPVDQ